MNDNVFSRDRLQPALLDRLIDEEPHSRTEPTEQKAISRTRLRVIVLRDLSWLLNASTPLNNVDERRYRYALQSVLNYGMPCLSGKLVSRIELYDMEQVLRQAIITFEPRILSESLVVTGKQPEDLSHHNMLEFDISGKLWAQPYPLELLLKTNLDLETGLVEVRDGSMSATVLSKPRTS